MPKTKRCFCFAFYLTNGILAVEMAANTHVYYEVFCVVLPVCPEVIFLRSDRGFAFIKRVARAVY